MLDNLFTTYEAVEPPAMYRDKAKFQIKDIEDNNFTLYPMVTTIDIPVTDFEDYPGVVSPFDILVELPFERPLIKTSSSNKGSLVVDLAREFLGKPYVWGSTDPDKGFDCSGLINYVYKLIGINIPRTSHAIGKIGTKVELSEVQPGDIIYTSSKGPSGGHVKMVSSVADGQIFVIEAKGKKWGIVEAPLTYTDNIKSIRRLLDSPVEEKSPSKESAALPPFKNQGDYVNTMYGYLYTALENNGINGELWTPILVTHTSIESAWGNEFSRTNNNFGGIKGKGSKVVSTKEWSPSKGYYTIKSTFKSYPSIQAFADDYVKMLKNKFKAFEGTPDEYLRNIRQHKYFTATLSDYSKAFNSRLYQVNKLLKQV